MRGTHHKQSPLFSYDNLEDQIPRDPPLREVIEGSLRLGRGYRHAAPFEGSRTGQDSRACATQFRRAQPDAIRKFFDASSLSAFVLHSHCGIGPEMIYLQRRERC